MAGVDELKQGHRVMWAQGSYPEMAEHIESAAEGLVAEAGIEPGQDVLDVATGSGNVAIPAAQAGARVVGLDLTPELFEAARRRATAAGVQVEWVEGDAEALPYEDESFDRVLSTFGVMFAPRHAVAAAELLRVCRPGGLIGLCNWTPEGVIGQMFRTVGSFMPPPPDFASPPPLWGTEDHVRELLPGIDLEFARRTVTWRFESVEAWQQFGEERFGPTIMAKRALEADGRWGELRAKLVDLFGSANEATDGTMHVQGEYLQVLGRKP